MIKSRSKKVYPLPNDEDIEKIKAVVKWTKINSQQVKEIERLIRLYFDESCNVCTHCPAQIKYAYKRLIRWWNDNQYLTMNLKELRQTYPDIKATSKADFIEKIKNKK
jgi:NADH:ubiquinone oxidoreductase subunit F (NADH-binding)